MQFSGLLVTSEASTFAACVRELEAHPGVDVYMTDAATSRVVVVLETETVEAQEQQFREIQRLPHVRSAELVYHYFGDTDGHPEPFDHKMSDAEN